MKRFLKIVGYTLFALTLIMSVYLNKVLMDRVIYLENGVERLIAYVEEQHAQIQTMELACDTNQGN